LTLHFLLLFLLFHILSFSPLLATSTPASTTIERSDQGISFLVIGDWGSGDNPAYAPTQAAVAQAMAQVGLQEKIQFVVSVGDNFYEDGVQSTTDPKWATSFVNTYTGEALQKRWYQMLGNHDYQGNVDAQLKYKADPRWHMPGRNYTFSLPVTGDIRATFIVIDTTPFVNEYYNYPQNEEMRNQLRDQHWEAATSLFAALLRTTNTVLRLADTSEPVTRGKCRGNWSGPRPSSRRCPRRTG